MKKRDKKKQDKLHKVTTKRALYEKARKLRIKAAKSKAGKADNINKSNQAE